MKYLILLLLPISCWANEYKFTFNMDDGRQLKVKVKVESRSEALEVAGALCGKFFLDAEKGELTEDKIAEITSVCANPSEK